MQKGVVVVHTTNFSIPHVKYHICSTKFPFDPPMQVLYTSYIIISNIYRTSEKHIR